MAFITLSGTLLDPNGDLAVGDQIRFTHKSTTGETVQSAVSIITVNPAGTYSLPLQYGLVLVEYKDVRTQQFKNLGVATVNQDNPATSIPELLNALVPVSSAELIEFQAILADCVTAQLAAENAATTAEAFAYQLTTTDLIASTATFAATTNIPTSGFADSGDGGNGSWKPNGITGQIPSQSPAQLGDALLNDGNGNQWALVGSSASIICFGGIVDGATDNTLVTDAVVNWGKKITFPVGTYVTEAFKLISKNLEIEGESELLSIIKMKDSTAQDVIALTGTANLKISNITIDQNFTTSGGGHGIRGGGCDSFILDNVTIQNCFTYGIGFQAGTNKGVFLNNITIKNTNSDGIDIKDYNSDNDCIFITNYSAYNVSILNSDNVALDVRGEVNVNGISVQAITTMRGIRLRPSSVQGRSGFGTINNFTFKSVGVADTVAIQLTGESSDFTFNNVVAQGCNQVILQNVENLGGVISNISASGVTGDGISIGGSNLQVNNISLTNASGSSRLCDVEVTASNFMLNNFFFNETTASIQALRIQAGATNTTLSNGVISGGTVGDSGTGTVQSNVRLL